jgi:hypothetical protein
MTDFLFVLVTVGFFGLTVVFVRLIEWIVGREPVDATSTIEPLAEPRSDPSGDVDHGMTA